MYDSSPLYIDANFKSFRVVSLQTDNNLIMTDNTFATTEETVLKKAKLLAKNREKLTYNTPIKFDGGYIRLIYDHYLFLNQEKQCQYLCLVIINEPIDLVSSHFKIKKAIILKN